MSVHELEMRTAEHFLTGAEFFTVDDATDCGRITLDDTHAPSAGQNGVGAFINRMAQHGYIEDTGRIVKSQAPHRKGGMIRVWRITPKGVAWARTKRDGTLF